MNEEVLLQQELRSFRGRGLCRGRGRGGGQVAVEAIGLRGTVPLSLFHGRP